MKRPETTYRFVAGNIGEVCISSVNADPLQALEEEMLAHGVFSYEHSLGTTRKLNS